MSTSHNNLGQCFKVSEISSILKHLLEENFSNIKVQGEISGLKKSTKGHIYFSLKDEAALLNAICWHQTIENFKLRLEDGMEVICRGKLSSYPGRSNYQLIVDEVAISGSGTLFAALEKRKQKLSQEGLFDEARKKPLPLFPTKIGIITSLNGVVIRDILHRISARFPIEILIWNVAVQGNEAANQIVQAISGFNQMSDPPSILILARGGGSIEDLWCFNEEAVVRAVAHSSIPLISAIGHETDFTLTDFAADLRAPTPTAAAELAVPVLKSVRDKINVNLSRCGKSALGNLLALNCKLLRCANILEKAESSYANKQKELTRLYADIRNQTTRNLHQFKTRLELLKHLLLKYDQYAVLKKGFAIVKQEHTQKILSSKAEILKESKVCIEMQDGTILVTIDS